MKLPVRNKSILLILAIFFIGTVEAQNCEEQLVSAQRAYYNGNLEKVISSLSACVQESKMNHEDREDALELLINAHLILKEDSVADFYMNKLLTISPLTETKSSDLVEFRRLHASYDIKPKRNYGLTLGISDPVFRTLQYRSLGSISTENNNYNTKPGIILGFKLDQYLTKNVFVSSGIYFNRFTYDRQELLLTYQQSFIAERLDFINIPIALGYQFQQGNYDYFISGGMAANILLSSKGDLELFGIQSDNSITIIPGIPEKVQSIDLGHQRDGIVFNYLINLGIRRRIGLMGLEVCAQYDIGANNLVDESGRYSNEEVWGKYSYVPDDFKVDSFKLMFSVSRRFYQSEKSGIQ